MPQHSIQLKSPTGRIHLLPMSEADDPNVSTLRAHPITRQFLRFLPEKFTIDDARELREKAARDFETTTQFKIVVHDENGAVSNPFAGMMGTFRLDAANNSVEIGLLVAPDLHRQGVATEGIYTILAYVFEDKKLHRAHFVTGADNIKMRNWLENVCGAHFEGEAREAWKDGDGYSNSMTYSILEWEWRDTVKERLLSRIKGKKAAIDA